MFYTILSIKISNLMIFMANKIIIVAGLSGAGKTTLLNKLNPGNYKIINIGTLMKGELSKKGEEINRDTIKKLSNKELSKLRNIVFGRVQKLKSNIVLDTHITIESGLGILPGIPYSTLRFLNNLSALVYINAPSKDIIKRRNTDKSRNREKQDAFNIDMQRLVDMSTISYYTSHLNISLYVINNKSGCLIESFKKLQSAIDNVLGE